jgi:hypothetical protein
MAGCHSKKVIYILATIVALLFSFPAAVSVYAQVAGATLPGTVTDASGAVINASFRQKHGDWVTRDVTADAAGLYSAPNLLLGAYDVSASAPGFFTQLQIGSMLTVGASYVLNFPLQVGQVTERTQVAIPTAGHPRINLVVYGTAVELENIFLGGKT